MMQLNGVFNCFVKTLGQLSDLIYVNFLGRVVLPENSVANKL